VRPLPFVDLAAQHAEVARPIARGLARVFARTGFILGEEVAQFERAFADFCGLPHCVGVASGTDAIELGLRALGLGRGDEVILPANTFVATALAVLRAGATPVLCDCHERTLLISGADAARRIGRRTRALLPVHLYGQMADMAAMAKLARDAGLHLLEDAAQAHGASQRGRGLGSASAMVATSFYPGKNLGAYGDGGAVLTRSPKLARKLRALRNYGSEVKYHHPEVGFNSRLDTVQAVVLSAKLARLAAWNRARTRAARRYDQLLRGLDGVATVDTAPGNVHVHHLYVVRVLARGGRERALARLNQAGIAAAIHYPVPLHLQGALRALGHRKGDFPVAERVAAQVLSLPMHPHLKPADQERVIDVLRQAIQ
jgi:dTDP-4-amino-4,6-dideoxygalactose transaminase